MLLLKKTRFKNAEKQNERRNEVLYHKKTLVVNSKSCLTFFWKMLFECFKIIDHKYAYSKNGSLHEYFNIHY